MKHLLPCTLLAVLPTLACAQSTITLYGRVNTSLESQKLGSGERETLLVDNASRFGLRGTEDLGDGLKAGFVLEHGFAADGTAKATPMWNRQASIQLGGSAGALRLGHWLPGSYLAVADYVSLHNHDTGSSSDALYAFTAFPLQNKIGYFTPTLAGWTGELAVSLGEGQAPRTVDLSANHVAGPLHLGGGYTKQDKASQFAGRALYFFGPFALGGYVQHETVQGSLYGDSRNIYRLAAMYTLGASELHLNLGRTGQGGVQAEPARQYTLAYNHNLSPRTKVYAFYSAIRRPASGQDFSSLAVGVRHNF